MNEIEKYNEKIFEEIKHIDENGNEYWAARELQIALDYKKWQKFKNVIENAKTACEQSGFLIDNHFTQMGKMVNIGFKTSRSIEDYKLSRYACYLIVQNSDPKKEVVALGQTYFVIQNRKIKNTEEEYENLRFQSGPSSIKEYSVHRYNPYIFTEHGVAITSMLINFFIGGKIFGIKSR